MEDLRNDQREWLLFVGRDHTGSHNLGSLLCLQALELFDVDDIDLQVVDCRKRVQTPVAIYGTPTLVHTDGIQFVGTQALRKLQVLAVLAARTHTNATQKSSNGGHAGPSASSARQTRHASNEEDVSEALSWPEGVSETVEEDETDRPMRSEDLERALRKRDQGAAEATE